MLQLNSPLRFDLLAMVAGFSFHLLHSAVHQFYWILSLPLLILQLVVMGASSASIPDTTINTSTDSACTLITNVTHTDTSETCDSLDLGASSLVMIAFID